MMRCISNSAKDGAIMLYENFSKTAANDFSGILVKMLKMRLYDPVQ